MKADLKINQSEFRSALREYVKHTKRDLPTILNTKGFYIARGAARSTHKASEAAIKTYFGAAMVLKLVRGKGGMRFSRNKRGESTLGAMSKHNAPLLAVIINSKRGKSGRKGLQGADMVEAVKRTYKAILASIGFIKSGWIPAIKGFEPFAEKKSSAPPMDKGAKVIGQNKGGVIPARESWTPKAIFWNSASAKRDHKGALDRYATEGLQKAINDEVRSMREYIERKLQATANRFNARR